MRYAGQKIASLPPPFLRVGGGVAIAIAILLLLLKQFGHDETDVPHVQKSHDQDQFAQPESGPTNGEVLESPRRSREERIIRIWSEIQDADPHEGLKLLDANWDSIDKHRRENFSAFIVGKAVKSNGLADPGLLVGLQEEALRLQIGSKITRALAERSTDDALSFVGSIESPKERKRFLSDAVTIGMIDCSEIECLKPLETYLNRELDAEVGLRLWSSVHTKIKNGDPAVRDYWINAGRNAGIVTSE